LFEKASGLTATIIAGAIEVHRDEGSGLIESIYEWRLTKEFELRGLTCVSQKLVMIENKENEDRKGKYPFPPLPPVQTQVPRRFPIALDVPGPCASARWKL